MDGILLINKPRGITSHDVVSIVRRRLKMKKVGHAGSLDPLATGVLVVLLGKMTKLSAKFMDFDKAYEATLTLGAVTDTGDSCGKVIKEFSYEGVSEENIRRAFAGFVGEINQVPPMVSALKYKGKPLYKLARLGIEVPRKPRVVKIYDLDILDLSLPDISFRVRCSKGTYVRTLGEDIAKSLGCGGHISKITRVAIGPLTIQKCITVDQIDENHIRTWKDI